MNSTTGIKSTSFWTWLLTFATGIGTVVTAFAQNAGTIRTSSEAAVGGVVALGSTLGKLFHDHGVTVATVTQAGSALTSAIPSIRADVSAAVTATEQDIPELKGIVGSLTSRVAGLESKLPDLSAIEAILKAAQPVPVSQGSVTVAGPPNTAATPVA